MTRDDKTREVIATVKKVRLGNLDIHSPKRAADWRISVNVEVPGAYILISVAHGRQVLSVPYSATSIGFAGVLTSKRPHQLYPRRIHSRPNTSHIIWGIRLPGRSHRAA